MTSDQQGLKPVFLGSFYAALKAPLFHVGTGDCKAAVHNWQRRR